MHLMLTNYLQISSVIQVKPHEVFSITYAEVKNHIDCPDYNDECSGDGML